MKERERKRERKKENEREMDGGRERRIKIGKRSHVKRTDSELSWCPKKLN